MLGLRFFNETHCNDPSNTGQDLRTYGCPQCNRSERHIIESAVTEAWLAPKN
jgi:hypothetical protein